MAWIGLTVFGARLHLLALLARARSLSRAMPSPAPVRDAVVTVAAGIGIGGLAISHARRLGASAGPRASSC